MLGEVVIMNALSHCLQSAKDCHENTNSSLNDLINLISGIAMHQVGLVFVEIEFVGSFAKL